MAVVPNSIRPNSELVIPVKLSKRVYGEMVTVQMFELNKKEVLAQQTELVNGKSLFFPLAQLLHILPSTL